MSPRISRQGLLLCSAALACGDTGAPDPGDGPPGFALVYQNNIHGDIEPCG